MRVAEFVQLPLEAQAYHLVEQGQYLIDKKGQRSTVTLYALEDFYVEVWYNREYNSITAITCFKKVSKLDAYLNPISLQELTSF
jgi:hypothetical protein